MKSAGAAPVPILVLIIIICSVLPALHQVGTASITGIVSDSTIAVIPGVTVKPLHAATGVVYQSATNEVLHVHDRRLGGGRVFHYRYRRRFSAWISRRPLAWPSWQNSIARTVPNR